MDWSELKTAAAQCTRCDLCRGRKKSVFGRGSQSAVWLVLGSGPSRAGEKLGQPLGADAADLLGNMLLAIGLETERDVYLTTLVKCRPADANGAERDPTSDEVAACRPYLERELALTQAGAIIAIGLDAAGGLLGQAVRGSVHRHGAIPVVVTHHPEQLLLQGQDKAQAWADLCLARSLHGNRT